MDGDADLRSWLNVMASDDIKFAFTPIYLCWLKYGSEIKMVVDSGPLTITETMSEVADRPSKKGEWNLEAWTDRGIMDYCNLGKIRG